VREALLVIWEASDRICGKRLKPLVPVLLDAMERHGHLAREAEVRAGLLAMSAATIDRALRAVREKTGQRGRRRGSASSAVQRSIPVRTFSDWEDPPPGFIEADLVAHSGPVASGSFIQTLVLTDIATGWTECAPLLVREQTVLVEVLSEVCKLLPFELLGFDTDNDSVFMNETTARRPALSSPAVGHTARMTRRGLNRRTGRSSGGLSATGAMRVWKRPRNWPGSYATVRLFINFFQPSFKLAGKQREGAQAVSPAGNAGSATADGPQDVGGRLAPDRGLASHPGSRSSAQRDAFGPAASGRDRRSDGVAGPGGKPGADARGVSQRTANGLAEQ
jgi:hypothetical protein